MVAAFAALLSVLLVRVLSVTPAFESFPNQAKVAFFFSPFVVLIIVIWLSFRAHSDDKQDDEFRIFLANENPELLAKWTLRQSRQLAPPEGDSSPVAGQGQEEAITEAIADLGERAAEAPNIVSIALRELERGETKSAEAIFDSAVRDDSLAPEVRGRSARHLGALRSMNDTKGAISAYETALSHQPDDSISMIGIGILLAKNGNFASAEELFKRALEIDKAIGRKEGEAGGYGNLANLYAERGDSARAKQMYEKSLDIHEALGRKDGVARQYGNLGNIYQMQGDLEKAEAMYLAALDIDLSLDRKEGLAANYSNLGVLYKNLDDLDQAEEMHLKALDINEALGRAEGLASNYINLGILNALRGNLETAEQMLEKSLDINKDLDHKAGVASSYSNLGKVYKEKGDIEGANRFWQKSLRLYNEIGAKDKIVLVKGWIDESEKNSV